MNILRTTLSVILVAASAGVCAQQQAQPGRPCGAASGASAPAQGCVGPGGPGPHMRGGPDDTSGWSMMSPAERQSHRDRMAGFMTVDECRSYMGRHHDEMVARAKETGQTVPALPRRDACLGMNPQPAK